ESEGTARGVRDLLIDVAQALEVGRVGDENPRHNARARRVANRILTHGKRLEERWMRLLVGLGNDTDFAHYPLRIDLARYTVLAGPFGHRPALNPLLVGIGNLIVLAIVRDGVLGPGLTNDLHHLFVDIAVMLVNR